MRFELRFYHASVDDWIPGQLFWTRASAERARDFYGDTFIVKVVDLNAEADTPRANASTRHVEAPQ